MQTDTISSVDLSRVRILLKHREGWDAERIARGEKEYREYLELIKQNGSRRFPVLSEDMDKVWHYHILDTANYTKDCKRVFGHYVHHEPCLPKPETEYCPSCGGPCGKNCGGPCCEEI